MTLQAASISTSDVDVRIGDIRLLSDISCTFPGRGVTGLVGQNGSGKSTLLRVLARQLKPQRGTVALAGAPVEAMSDRAFAREVAYLPQSLPQAPGMTVRELVSLGRYPWHGALGRFSAEDEARVEEALQLTGSKALSDRFVDSLSGGERQRCWLAMLLAQGARLLLLDEPTSALDLAHQFNVLHLIRDICRERGVTAIIVIHDINLAARFCDFVVALKAGRLVAEGVSADIMIPAQLEAIFDVRMTVAPHPQSGRPFCFIEDPADA